MYQQLNTTEDYSSIKNCLLYARVSTDRQVKEGHSFEDQIKRLTAFARERNWRILDVYKDGGKSGGSTTGRPEFNRMLERCESDPEVHAVLLEETDRFARNAQDHLAVKSFLKKHNVFLIATQQPNFGDDPVGNFVDLIMAGANQLQREITGQKTKRTMVSIAEKGIQPGPALIGYLNSHKKGEPWSIDKEREYFIKEIFRLYHTDTYSIYRIEEQLYQEGFRTPLGNKVRANAIHRTLTDVRYAGKVLYDGKMYDGLHTPIVTMEDIEKSKEIMQKHNKGADRSRKHNWFLAGLTFCKTCGTLMSGEQHIKKETGQINKYYRCLGQKSYGKGCIEPYAVMEEIHTQLDNWICGLTFEEGFFEGLRTELRTLMQQQGTDIPSQIKLLKKRKEVIEKKMDSLEDQIINEIIPKERIEKKYAPLRDELKAVEAQIEKLNKPSANLDDQKIEKIVSFLKRLPELYEVFTKPERKQFLNWLITKIWIKDKKIVGVDYTEGFEALLNRDLVRISNTWLAVMNEIRTFSCPENLNNSSVYLAQINAFDLPLS